MSAPTDLVLTFVPSLVSTLLRHEQDKGSPLTEQEVLAIRDRCPAIALPRDVAAKMTESRGYEDINPQYCWEQWQQLRPQLSEMVGPPNNRWRGP